MAGLPDLLNFVSKLSDLWKHNKSARLAAECHGGKATVSLHLQLGLHTPEEVHQPPPPRPSPSRLRRRARRAQAHAEAAANAASTEEIAVEAVQFTDTAVQTVEDGTTLVEAAVQTVSTTKEIAIQAAPPQQPVQPPRHVPAVTAGWHPQLPHVPAVSAARPHLHHVPDVNAAPHLHQARHPPLDVFCPDEEYKESFNQINLGIPQVDGFEEISNIKCDHCSKPFETTKQLQHHEEKNQFGCDECFHCYTSKFYADLHELEQHPDTFYVRDHIPSSTKEHFARLQHQRFR